MISLQNFRPKNFLLILLIVGLNSCMLKSSEGYRKEANQLEQQEKYREAILLLNKSIEKDPNNIKALLDRAVDKSILEDYKGAIDDYSKVIELHPGNTLAYLNRGKNKARLENHQSAIADFEKAISTKGGELLYINKKENPFVETGFEFDVEMSEIKFERGISFYNIDSLKRAFQDFSFSIQENYALPDSYYFRGLIYLRTGMKEEGCKDLQKSAELGDVEAKALIQKNCK